MDGVEVSVMAWSSTTVDVSHMHPSLMCEAQPRVCFKACELLEGQQVCWCWASPVAWRECRRGGVVKSVGGKWMDVKKASCVDGIVTWLWWLVFGLWCPHMHTTAPSHQLISSCVGGAVCGG